MMQKNVVFVGQCPSMSGIPPSSMHACLYNIVILIIMCMYLPWTNEGLMRDSTYFDNCIIPCTLDCHQGMRKSASMAACCQEIFLISQEMFKEKQDIKNEAHN
jgi:hypothetical protein